MDQSAPTPKRQFKSAAALFFVQLFSYGICSISYIVMNRGQYALTFGFDLLFGLNAFFIVKRIVHAEDKLGWDAAAYTLGGATGSVLAIWVTKHWLHQ